MQIFKCPFCGYRNETEFFYAGEAGTNRPGPAAEVSAENWSDYQYAVNNFRGASAEVWRHQTCGELFIMKRDTATMEVLEIVRLRKSEP